MKGLTQTTISLKPADTVKSWVVIDAEGMVLGRLAAIVAMRLRGKHRADYTPHVDCGDHIIIINAEKIALTGRKLQQKRFYWHTGHPGGIKSKSIGDILSGTHPERVIGNAVRRMLPEGPLARQQFSNLRIYPGNHHPHQAQQPQLLALAPVNPKNSINRSVEITAKSGSVLNNREAISLLDKPAEHRKVTGTSRVSGAFASLETLILKLDGSAPAIVAPLNEIAALVPELDLDECMMHDEMRSSLKALPERLMAILAQSLDSEETARAAAFALVVSMFPDHYQGNLSKPEKEKRALEDFENLVSAHRIDSIVSMKVSPSADAKVALESRLWAELPFRFAGRQPALLTANWIDAEAGLSIDVHGATASHIQQLGNASLKHGSIAGCYAELTPNQGATKGKVTIYIKNGPSIIDRYVYDQQALFRNFA